MSNEEVTQYVKSKGTLSRPTECPNLLWDIMQKCWDWFPMKRPTCFEIIDMLQVKYVLEINAIKDTDLEDFSFYLFIYFFFSY